MPLAAAPRCTFALNSGTSHFPERMRSRRQALRSSILRWRCGVAALARRRSVWSVRLSNPLSTASSRALFSSPTSLHLPRQAPTASEPSTHSHQRIVLLFNPPSGVCPPALTSCPSPPHRPSTDPIPLSATVHPPCAAIPTVSLSSLHLCDHRGRLLLPHRHRRRPASTRALPLPSLLASRAVTRTRSSHPVWALQHTRRTLYTLSSPL